MHSRTLAHTRLHTHTHTHACTHTHARTHARTYTRVRAHTHTHTQTQLVLLLKGRGQHKTHFVFVCWLFGLGCSLLLFTCISQQKRNLNLSVSFSVLAVLCCFWQVMVNKGDILILGCSVLLSMLVFNRTGTMTLSVALSLMVALCCYWQVPLNKSGRWLSLTLLTLSCLLDSVVVGRWRSPDALLWGVRHRCHRTHPSIPSQPQAAQVSPSSVNYFVWFKITTYFGHSVRWGREWLWIFVCQRFLRWALSPASRSPLVPCTMMWIWFQHPDEYNLPLSIAAGILRQQWMCAITVLKVLLLIH